MLYGKEYKYVLLLAAKDLTDGSGGLCSGKRG